MPDDLRALVMCQKHEVLHKRFGRDVDDLIEAIRGHATIRQPKKSRAFGWRRIGIVGSVIWFVSFALILWTSETGRISDFYGFQLRHCKTILDMATEGLGNRPILDSKEKIDEYDRRWEANWAKYEKCQEEAREFYRREAGDSVKGIPILLAIDFGSVGLGWLIAWLIARVVRWVHRGFALAG
jgi:hypothetical protein